MNLKKIAVKAALAKASRKLMDAGQYDVINAMIDIDSNNVIIQLTDGTMKEQKEFSLKDKNGKGIRNQLIKMMKGGKRMIIRHTSLSDEVVIKTTLEDGTTETEIS